MLWFILFLALMIWISIGLYLVAPILNATFSKVVDNTIYKITNAFNNYCGKKPKNKPRNRRMLLHYFSRDSHNGNHTHNSNTDKDSLESIIRHTNSNTKVVSRIITKGKK